MRMVIRRPLHLRVVAVSLLFIVLASCGQSQPHSATTSPRTPGVSLAMHQGLSVVNPPDSAHTAAGQTIYVPAYSSIYISDHADRYNLAITLAVRNTDQTHPIVVTSVRYLGEAGQIVRDYLEKPIQLAPLASAGFFVAESDSNAGALASFLVEWVAAHPVSSPIAEATMVGIAGNQGVSFHSPGRVIANHPTISK